MYERDEHGFIAHRWLPDGRLLAVVPLITGTAKLTIGTDTLQYDDGW